MAWELLLASHYDCPCCVWLTDYDADIEKYNSCKKITLTDEQEGYFLNEDDFTKYSGLDKDYLC